ncbi:putative WRKY transcription factor 13 [Canna indica]|uniref:WRKY transcription factor 13 n=1 Tax=Canna indica TaxID=4628 RepID=A0AAQ3KI98_9LILI|nr:putative WRKY transcription factor 13 [Canna indica]
MFHPPAARVLEMLDHHQLGFTLQSSSPLPPLTFPCFGLQLDRTCCSTPGGPGGGDQVRFPASSSSSSAQISSSIAWAWTGDHGEDAILRKKKEVGKPDDDDKKEKKSSDENRVSSAARMVMMKRKKKVMRKKVREPRFCFKTMSEVDVLDDGYKWRKYGQKVVKNTQHPRSYYRCTQDNCKVKKRIERLAEDPRMVITTYEGRHVHSPSHDEDDSYSSSKVNLFW